MDRSLSLRAGGALVLLAAVAWLLWPTPPPPPPAPEVAPPAPPRVLPRPRPAPAVPSPPAGDPIRRAFDVLAESEGATQVVCPFDAPFGRHPFLRAQLLDGQLLGLAPDPSGRGLIYPPPPRPGALGPGELGPALLAAREPLAALVWTPAGCEVHPVPTVRLAGRVVGAPTGSSWVVGCGLLMAPTDDRGGFEAEVPGGEPCALQVEGRGPSHALSGDGDALDLVLPWPPDEGLPEDQLAAHLHARRAELDALDAMSDPLEAALAQDLDPEVRAVLEAWLADERALRAQQAAVWANLPKGPVREATDLEDLETFPTPP